MAVKKGKARQYPQPGPAAAHRPHPRNRIGMFAAGFIPRLAFFPDSREHVLAADPPSIQKSPGREHKKI